MSNGPPSRDRRSLQDLAKLASSPSLAPNSARTPPPPPVAPSGDGHDSGIVDLKSMAKNDAGAAERAKTTPLASTPLFEDETPSVAPPPLSVPPPASAKVPSTSPRALASATPSRPALSALSAQAVLAPPQKSGSGGMLMPVLVGLALAGLAAIGYMVTRPAKTDAAKSDTAASLTSPASSSAAAGPAASSPSGASSASNPSSAAPPGLHVANDTATDPASLPASGGGDPGRSARRASGGGGGSASNGRKAPAEPTGGTAVSGLSAMMAQASNSPSTAPVTPQAAAPAGALGEAVQHAVGGGNAPAAAAETAAPSGPQFAPGSVPEKPSQGAVTSALSRALPEARNCLGSDDPVSKANVTFSSAGAVTAVVVSGSAAGKPAEECIKTALMKASVPPFAQAAYSANVTVRPN